MTEAMPRNFGARTSRRASWIDTAVDNAVAFIQRVAKQMFITIVVASFKAAGEWILSKGDDTVSNTLRSNMNPNGYNSGRSSSSYNAQYDNDYYSRYGANEQRSSTNFPGFNGTSSAYN